MKLILKQEGFERYNGQMGVIQFVNGKSIHDVSPLDAVRCGAVMLCEWENGQKPTLGSEFGELQSMSAPIVLSGQMGDEPEAPAPVAPAVTSGLAMVDPEKVMAEAAKATMTTTAGAVLTEADLGAIADKEGVAGIRAIADQYGVKAKSINELIAGILKAQAVLEARKTASV